MPRVAHAPGPTRPPPGATAHRGESDPQGESCGRQEAASFPCLAVASSCEAVVRIASVFIGKFFHRVVHTASTNSLGRLGNLRPISEQGRWGEGWGGRARGVHRASISDDLEVTIE